MAGGTLAFSGFSFFPRTMVELLWLYTAAVNQVDYLALNRKLSWKNPLGIYPVLDREIIAALRPFWSIYWYDMSRGEQWHSKDGDRTLGR